MAIIRNKRNVITDDYFRKFATSLERAIARYGDLNEETLVERQKRQVEKLVELETTFRHTLIKHYWGPGVYRKFVRMICDEKRNILAARPFFRERQPIFTKEIAKALKLRADVSLYKFHFNYQFVLFAMRARPWPVNGKLGKLATEIAELRIELVEMNMPLAIARARLFWGGTPRAHLTYMDLVQISCEGLMAAIDKFVLPYSQTFRHVAIGRILGNCIENYSETLVHFYPSDKRKLYRANKLIKNQVDVTVNYEQLARGVNEWPGAGGVNTNASEIADLMSAASCVSAHCATRAYMHGEEEEMSAINRFAADSSSQPDIRFEETEARQVTSRAIVQLSIIEQKLLKMSGITL